MNKAIEIRLESLLSRYRTGWDKFNKQTNLTLGWCNIDTFGRYADDWIQYNIAYPLVHEVLKMEDVTGVLRVLRHELARYTRDMHRSTSMMSNITDVLHCKTIQDIIDIVEDEREEV